VIAGLGHDGCGPSACIAGRDAGVRRAARAPSPYEPRPPRQPLARPDATRAAPPRSPAAPPVPHPAPRAAKRRERSAGGPNRRPSRVPRGRADARNRHVAPLRRSWPDRPMSSQCRDGAERPVAALPRSPNGGRRTAAQPPRRHRHRGFTVYRRPDSCMPLGLDHSSQSRRRCSRHGRRSKAPVSEDKPTPSGGLVLAGVS
jgi:hypothetical protein